MALIGDAQSCNVLIAEQTLNINAKYSLAGMTPQNIENSLKTLRSAPLTKANMRLLQRISQRQLAAAIKGYYYIHPDRELIEYLCFLHAILDDTDLLTKVSKRDVECVVELLNRVKSLTIKEDVEVINLDDIARDKDFAKIAAKFILQHPEMYSLYSKIYRNKEQEVENNLKECQEEHFERLFADTVCSACIRSASQRVGSGGCWDINALQDRHSSRTTRPALARRGSHRSSHAKPVRA